MPDTDQTAAPADAGGAQVTEEEDFARGLHEQCGVGCATKRFLDALAVAREEASRYQQAMWGMEQLRDEAFIVRDAATARAAHLRQIALELRTDATDTFFVACFRCDTEPTGRYIKCDYHNMRDAEKRFDAALAEWDAALAAPSAGVRESNDA